MWILAVGVINNPSIVTRTTTVIDLSYQTRCWAPHKRDVVEADWLLSQLEEINLGKIARK